ncbi:MAG: regulatory protein RecX [Mariprofundales bacterium]|nr:regulatory protein RecX [Mariprofundales bacterium]
MQSKPKKSSHNHQSERQLLDSRALYSRAIWLLTRQEYSSRELDRKLCRVAADRATVAPIITRLQQQGYLSDQRFAESYLRSRLQRGDSVRVAMQRAEQRGVESTILHEAVADLDVDEEAACRRLLHKRDPQGKRFDDRRLWQRHLRYLCSKGYTINIVMQAMQQRDLRSDLQ